MEEGWPGFSDDLASGRARTARARSQPQSPDGRVDGPPRGYPRDKLVVAATNHEGLLDPALWRRFDEVLHFGKPTPAQLVRLIELRLGSVRQGRLDVAALAKKMRSFTFADAERVCFEATKATTLAGVREVTQDMLLAELTEQNARIQLSHGRTASKR